MATKLHIPAPRRHLVPRARLVSLLADVDGRRLALVCAPPGSGKTTLLAEWHAYERGRRDFAWLSLDRGDNDPVRFWNCVLEALRTVIPAFGAQAEAALQAPGTNLVEAVVPLVVNELHEAGRPIVLVLDDYHEITQAAVHESVALLVDHLPPGTQVAIASRTDPPLPLARLRVRHELAEIRAADLGFNAEEATALLNVQHGLALAPDLIARLHGRTEGWAAGLQLAAITLQGRADAAEFIDLFAGDDRQVVDYLAYEVLDRLDEDTRRFLLETSVLDRLSGPLCDAVTGRQGSAERLEALLRGGLFTVALDERQEWYRYHHLFGDLLRHDLARADPAAVPPLHRRASEWLREHGFVEEAIGHALEAGDADHAAELVARNWNSFFNRGCLATVSGWLAALPEDAVANDQRLWLAHAWTSLDGGDLGAAATLFDKEVATEARAWRDLLQALHRFKTGDVAEARAELERLPSGGGQTLFWRTVACCVTGVCDYWLGAPGARESLVAAEQLALRDGNQLGALYAMGYVALVDADARDWPDVERRVGGAAAIEGDEPRVGEHFVAMAVRMAEGRLAEHEGRLDDADAAFARAVELARRGAGRGELLCALLGLSDLRRRAGELDSARELTAEARATMATLPDPRPFAELQDAAERGLHLRHVQAAKPAADSGDALSSRELAVLRLLPTGLSQREIGDRLFVSVNTVKTHVRAIYRKLDAPSRDDAVGRARELGIL